MDDDDSSVTRPDTLLHELFERANLQVIRELQQRKFPKDIYQVKMYALRPKH